MKDYISIIIALVSLGISVSTAYYGTLRPGKIEGSTSHLIFWQYSMMKDGRVTDRAFTPYFWFKNVGAMPVVIDDIRLIFRRTSERFYSYPVNLVSRTIFNHDGGTKVVNSVRSGAPYAGFALEKGESFISNFNFHIDKSLLPKIRSKMNIQVEILSEGQWTSVGDEQEYDFGPDTDIDADNIFKNMKGASVPEGEESSYQIFVYPASYQQRRQQARSSI